MPSFEDLVISKNLQAIEYEQLLAKGYLNVRVELSLGHLREFQSLYSVGDVFTFHTPSAMDVKTVITSIDIGPPFGQNYRIYIGFTLLV